VAFKIPTKNMVPGIFAASYKNASNHPACWDHRLYVHKPRSFPPNRAPKMRESQQLFLRLRLVGKMFEENQQSAVQTNIEHYFGRFFQQIKDCVNGLQGIWVFFLTQIVPLDPVFQSCILIFKQPSWDG
jgi:hypothetical protein